MTRFARALAALFFAAAALAATAQTLPQPPDIAARAYMLVDVTAGGGGGGGGGRGGGARGGGGAPFRCSLLRWPQREATRLASLDLRLAAWFLWMTPLETALSSLREAALRCSSAASLSPASTVSRTRRT